MHATTALVSLALALFASATPQYDTFGILSRTLQARTGSQIAFACYGGGGDCQCPTDLNGDSGVLINVYPGYQCAYVDGACTWDDVVSPLELPPYIVHDLIRFGML